ncbi:hypothetical protein [Emticicia sp. C21]|uniref:hypothetical protein n=1 Tax=Emticicia sp. C21 TaxID=2302915 RepID=UPI000E344EE5|nr:hypothetical protein [Emticicia sp. C21]RFS15584.1 hypothetical protein D0T08_15670 [Emticicia sp. C21]
MIKISVLSLLLIIELTIFYRVDSTLAYPFRGIIHLFMAWWYYSERKNELNLTDRLFLISCLVPAITPIPIYIFGFTWGTLLEAVMLLVSYQLLIKIYSLEGAEIRLANNLKTFGMILTPYVFFPLAYFFFIVYPVAKPDVLLITSIYLIQIMYMAVLSAYLPFSEKSKLYISLGMFFILFASGASVHRVYVAPYEFDYGIVRIAANLGRILIIIGLLNRTKREIFLPKLA